MLVNAVDPAGKSRMFSHLRILVCVSFLNWFQFSFWPHDLQPLPPECQRPSTTIFIFLYKLHFVGDTEELFTLAISHSLWVFLYTPRKHKPTLYSLSLTHFTPHDALEPHPHCSQLQDSVFLEPVACRLQFLHLPTSSPS